MKDGTSTANTELKRNVPLYYRLKETLVNDIRRGVYAANTRIPSEAELMKKYNVSYSTVYRVRLELVNEGVIYAIQGKGCFVSSPAEEKTSRVTSRKAVVIFPVASEHYYFYGLLAGIIEFMQSKDYNVELFHSYAQYDKEAELLRKLIVAPPTGLIFVPSFHEANYKHLLTLMKKNVPVVLVEKRIKDFNTNIVGLDNIKAAKKAVKYLIELGHRKIVYLGGNTANNIVSRDRQEGYLQALKTSRIASDPDLILDIKEWESEGSAYKRIKEFLSHKKKFTALFAFNDDMAIGACRALREKNLKVPGDISIIGFDDTEKVRYLEVPLTTMRQDIPRTGYYAAKMLYDRMQRRQEGVPLSAMRTENRKLTAKLVVRKSTKHI